MRIFGLTDVGRVRKENQDSYAFRTLGENTAVLVVCDGMGGARAGSTASAVAVETFAAAVEEGFPAVHGPVEAEELLTRACSRANSRVFALSEANEEYRGMGTTLVAALVAPGLICVVHVGDSRCYLLEGGTIRQVTMDHSLVQMLVNRGEITPAEARTHPKRNLITRALGVEPDVISDLDRVEPRPGARLLLCSDGLSNVLTEEDILRISASESEPDAVCRRLLEAALQGGAPDNVTVVVAEM